MNDVPNYTLDEVMRELKCLPNGKKCGLDGVGYENFKRTLDRA